jgi:hypothetical protein
MNKEIKHEHDPGRIGSGLVQLIALAISVSQYFDYWSKQGHDGL